MLAFASLHVSAAEVNDFFVAPDGVSITVSNSTSAPYLVNEKGELMSDMHDDSRSATITFNNKSKTKLLCTFEISVSSEKGYDKFGFAIGDGMYQYISGDNYSKGLFQYVEIRIDAGSSLSFCYYKDKSMASGNDCGYVRNLVFATLADDASEWAYSLSSTATTHTASVLMYYGNDVDVDIPTTFTRDDITYTVNAIGLNAFYGKNMMKSVSIPSSLTSIGDYAFSYCSSLEEVVLPNTVSSIGMYAFEGCTSLASINIPTKLTALSDYLFEDCTSLTAITLPTGVKSIGFNAFMNCRNLASINFPTSLTSLDYFAFNNCTSLTSVVIPKSVTSINDNVFAGCSSLTSIVVDAANTKYDSRNNCNAIISKSSNLLISGCMNTVIPDDVPIIGSYAFYKCTKLKGIHFPESVKGIGYNAFEGCESLVSLDLTSVQSIGSSAFCGCTNLKSVEFSNELLALSDYAFKGCSSLTNVDLPDSITVGKSVFSRCSSLESATIPAYIGTLGDDLFAYCSNLKYVVFNGKVKTLSPYVFRHCPSLTCVVAYSQTPNAVQYSKDFVAGNTSGQATSFANCTLLVPSSAVDAYKSATGWRLFGTIASLPSESGNSLFAEKAVAEAGSRMTLSVMMNNEDVISGLSAKVKLPTGFRLADVEKPISIDTERGTSADMNANYEVLTDGSIDISVNAVPGNSFLGTYGRVLDIMVDIASTVTTGDYYVELSNSKLVTDSSQEIDLLKSISNVRVLGILLGDVNQDGAIDMLDVNAAVSIVTDRPRTNLLEAAADMNGDGFISIADVALLIDLIQRNSTPSPAQ